MASTVWSVSCLLFFYSRCPPCPANCKSGGTCLPCPMESATLPVTAVSLIPLVSTSIARRPYRNVFEAHDTNNCVDATLCVLFETFSQHRCRRKFDIQCAFGTTTREKKRPIRLTTRAQTRSVELQPTYIKQQIRKGWTGQCSPHRVSDRLSVNHTRIALPALSASQNSKHATGRQIMIGTGKLSTETTNNASKAAVAEQAARPLRMGRHKLGSLLLTTMPT